MLRARALKSSRNIHLLIKIYTVAISLCIHGSLSDVITFVDHLKLLSLFLHSRSCQFNGSQTLLHNKKIKIEHKGDRFAILAVRKIDFKAF